MAKNNSQMVSQADVISFPVLLGLLISNLLLRLFVGFSGDYSGKGTPPMFGDFEVSNYD